MTEPREAVDRNEALSRLYAWIADRTSRPDGSEWDHARLRVAASDLLNVLREVTR